MGIAAKHSLAFSLSTVLLVAITAGNSFSAAAENGARWTSLAFSADGQSLFASRDDPTAQGIYSISLSNGGVTRPAWASHNVNDIPVFSSDGKHLAYSRSTSKDSPSQILLANADGSNTRPLFSSDSHDLFPMFSAAPDRIYFARAGFYGNYDGIARPRLHEWDIYYSDLAGKNLQQLTHEKFYDISVPAISPDGKNLILAAFTEQGTQFQIYSLEKPSTARRVLVPRVPNTPGRPQFSSPIFLPDGQHLLFMAASQGKEIYDYDVYRMNLADGTLEKLTTENGYSTGLCISRDGKQAAFLKWTLSSNRQPVASEIILLNLATKTTTPLKIKAQQK